jgi:hypothetical protein
MDEAAGIDDLVTLAGGLATIHSGTLRPKG